MAKKIVPPTPSQICDRLLHENAISVEEAHTLRQSMISTFIGERVDLFLRKPLKTDQAFMNILQAAVAKAVGGMVTPAWPGFPEAEGDFPFVTFTVLDSQHDPGVIWIRSSVGQAHEKALEAVQEAFSTAHAFLSYLTDQNVRLCIPQKDGPDLDFLIDRDSSLDALFEAYLAALKADKGTGSDA
jgi:hypothetical protein